MCDKIRIPDQIRIIFEGSGEQYWYARLCAIWTWNIHIWQRYYEIYHLNGISHVKFWHLLNCCQIRDPDPIRIKLAEALPAIILYKPAKFEKNPFKFDEDININRFDLEEREIRPRALVKVIDLGKVTHSPKVGARGELQYGVN